MFADPVPIPSQAVSGELAGLMREPNVDVSTVALQIVDAMRNYFAICPTGKVMIESVKRFGCVNPALAIQTTEMLFRLGIY